MLTVIADALLVSLRRRHGHEPQNPWADRFVPSHLRDRHDTGDHRANPARDFNW